MRKVIEIEVALDPGGGDRIAGRVVSFPGGACTFDGWLGLISALDAELSPPGLDPPAGATPGREAGPARVDDG